MTEGKMGAIPDWYPLIRAAKYLGVAPWDLVRQPYFWQQKAIVAEQAENGIQEQLQQRAEAEAKVSR